MNINWFPGHMKKAMEEVKEHLSLADIAVELLDARIPYSSANPVLDRLIGEKKRIKVLTKSDLADEEALSDFIRRYGAVRINSLTGDGIRGLKNRISELSEEILVRLRARGRKPREMRVMVVGIPNVGKSSLINRIAGKNVCRSGNKPGVTRGRQWIHVAKGVSLCDTAGILQPKFESEEIGVRLALTGAIRDEILSVEELALKLLRWSEIRDSVTSYYGIGEDTEASALPAAVAIRRGYLGAGGRAEEEKAARLILEDFRSGKLGRFSLDRWDEFEEKSGIREGIEGGSQSGDGRKY